ncbi:MAG: hypothetical protein AABX79_00080 [Nanoarchaeota archaeon]
MLWYDPLLIIAFVTGLLFLFFSHHSEHHHKTFILWGMVLMLGSLITKAFLWLESMIP